MNEPNIQDRIRQLEAELDELLSCDLPTEYVAKELELLKQFNNEGCV